MHERPNLYRRRLSFTPYLPGRGYYNLTLSFRKFLLFLLFQLACSESPRSPCCGNVPSFVDGIPGIPQGILYGCNLFPFLVSVCPVHEVLHCERDVVSEFPNIPNTHIEGEHGFTILIIIHTTPPIVIFSLLAVLMLSTSILSVFESILQVILFFSLEFS